MPTYFCHIAPDVESDLATRNRIILWAIWVCGVWNRPWEAEQTCYFKKQTVCFHNHFPHTVDSISPWGNGLFPWKSELSWSKRLMPAECLQVKETKMPKLQQANVGTSVFSIRLLWEQETIRRNKMQGEGFRLLYLKVCGRPFLGHGYGMARPTPVFLP